VEEEEEEEVEEGEGAIPRKRREATCGTRMGATTRRRIRARLTARVRGWILRRRGRSFLLSSRRRGRSFLLSSRRGRSFLRSSRRRRLAIPRKRIEAMRGTRMGATTTRRIRARLRARLRRWGWRLRRSRWGWRLRRLRTFFLLL
jgi:hypothetical protein